ncbi:MAG TPA: carboxypeptidase-like regulatory domain-containing protein, partial [Gemmatimonadaceae bacterium]|nr:carboxypeptidase-like regulatory domain-containing protein [Gemmatimonadaceae bacterium]
MRNACAALTLILLGSIPSSASTQSPAKSINGVVQTRDRRQIANANVFILETLEGAITDRDGKFSIPVSDSAVTLVARSLGFIPVTLKLAIPFPDSVIITLEKAAPALDPITIVASAYTANEERTATLTPLEVVTIPGTAADINRALQTLPGVQQVDEGTGLFVRGGDAYETKVFLNDASLVNPVDIQSPNGTFMGTVDPFLLDRIVFSSGGFGARYGNALSAAVSLTTQRKPDRREISASAGLAGVSLSLAEPIRRHAGVRVAGNLFDLRPLIAVNGSGSHDYDPAPSGHDLSGSLATTSPRTGEFSVFAIQQASKLGVSVAEPTYTGNFRFTSRSNLAVASWRRETSQLQSTIALSAGNTDKNELYGAFDLETRLRQTHVFAQQEWIASDRMTVRGGAELEALNAQFEGTIPSTGIDVAPGSRTRVIGSSKTGTRSGVFLESDARISRTMRLITGARSDWSS